jgi:hypothetical protein
MGAILLWINYIVDESGVGGLLYSHFSGGGGATMGKNLLYNTRCSDVVH